MLLWQLRRRMPALVAQRRSARIQRMAVALGQMAPIMLLAQVVALGAPHASLIQTMAAAQLAALACKIAEVAVVQRLHLRLMRHFVGLVVAVAPLLVRLLPGLHPIGLGARQEA